ncbi:uncharacterized protein LOC129596586 [Paramacrobiotus metropolitanus]|uniref:uncharacterized protein LOC129596586 n=1 Tax=Paramacrobiotus metropolitanus TaxID=2943436 RepID=UPI0024458007|nr:uncharacterized protein LOC129596586 [Paramacrobiotus metropolitanus]
MCILAALLGSHSAHNYIYKQKDRPEYRQMRDKILLLGQPKSEQQEAQELRDILAAAGQTEMDTNQGGPNQFYDDMDERMKRFADRQNQYETGTSFNNRKHVPDSPDTPSGSKTEQPVYKMRVVNTPTTSKGNVTGNRSAQPQLGVAGCTNPPPKPSAPTGSKPVLIPRAVENKQAVAVSSAPASISSTTVKSTDTMQGQQQPAAPVPTAAVPTGQMSAQEAAKLAALNARNEKLLSTISLSRMKPHERKFYETTQSFRDHVEPSSDEYVHSILKELVNNKITDMSRDEYDFYSTEIHRWPKEEIATGPVPDNSFIKLPTALNGEETEVFHDTVEEPQTVALTLVEPAQGVLSEAIGTALSVVAAGVVTESATAGATADVDVDMLSDADPNADEKLDTE